MFRAITTLLAAPLVATLCGSCSTALPPVARPEASTRVDAAGRSRRVAPDATTSGDEAHVPRLPTGVAFETTLGEYFTLFRTTGTDRSRAHNVRLAAGLLDGALIFPGETFSFNAVVGARSRSAGFRKAHVIKEGELTDDWGGGTCQVASTLHAAALFAGLEMVEHSPHSRPSTYIELGLDATVVWPSVDLKIRNPFDFPVVVHTRVSDGVLSVTVEGDHRVRDVRVTTAVLARRHWEERIVDDPALPKGAREVTQLGGPGYTIRRTRTIADAEGARTETQTVHYPPTDRIVHRGRA